MPFADPHSIVVEERFRESLPDIEQLAEDIKAIGQLQPILVKEEEGQLTLVTGQRRLEACKKIGKQVWWLSQKSAQGTLDMSSPLQLRRMELMENLSRCNFTPVEESKAIAEIDKMMKQLYGERKPGPQTDDDTSWNYEQTALLIGVSSKSTVARAVKIAELADAVPDINEAESISEAERMLVREIQKAARAELIKRSQEKTVSATETIEIINQETGESTTTIVDLPTLSLTDWADQRIKIGSAEELIKQEADNSVTILIADPPYELDAFNRMVKGHYAQGTTKFDDKTPVDFAVLLPEFVRVLAPKGWLFMFGSLEQFLANREALTKLGLSVFEVPLVWVKGRDLDSINPSYNPQPFAWPSIAEERILMAKKGDPSVMKHRHNVIAVPKTGHAEKSHASEKPVELMEYLIEWVYLDLVPGRLLDPFCGSGASLIASLQWPSLDCCGFEKDAEIASITKSNLIAAKMTKEAECP